MQESTSPIDDMLASPRAIGVYVKLKTCFFFPRKVDFIGHIVRPGGLAVSQDVNGTQTVRNDTFLQTTTEVGSYRGSCYVYRKFIKGYAKTSYALSDMLHKKAYPIVSIKPRRNN